MHNRYDQAQQRARHRRQLLAYAESDANQLPHVNNLSAQQSVQRSDMKVRSNYKNKGVDNRTLPFELFVLGLQRKLRLYQVKPGGRR